MRLAAVLLAALTALALPATADHADDPPLYEPPSCPTLPAWDNAVCQSEGLAGYATGPLATWALHVKQFVEEHDLVQEVSDLVRCQVLGGPFCTEGSGSGDGVLG